VRRILPAVLTLSVVFLGCQAKEAMDKAAIAKDLKNRGVMDLAKEIANDKYTAPTDGKLTEAQVQMYLKVRDHEKQIAQVAKKQLQEHADASKKSGEHSLSGVLEGFKAMGSAADFMTADIRAAKDLGYNTQEYMWVKGQILAASSSVITEKFASATNQMMESAHAQMQKAYDEAKDEQTKQIYKQQLDEYAKQQAQTAQSQAAVDPAVAYNKQILSKYENALNAYTSELSKYDEKGGEAQKAMDDLQKNLDKSAADAQKH
jgi:hypothetical protein